MSATSTALQELATVIASRAVPGKPPIGPTASAIAFRAGVSLREAQQELAELICAGEAIGYRDEGEQCTRYLPLEDAASWVFHCW